MRTRTRTRVAYDGRFRSYFKAVVLPDVLIHARYKESVRVVRENMYLDGFELMKREKPVSWDDFLNKYVKIINYCFHSTCIIDNHGMYERYYRDIYTDYVARFTVPVIDQLSHNLFYERINIYSWDSQHLNPTPS